MMREAQRRGHSIVACEPRQLSWQRGGKVVALDEESLRTAPFKGAPMLTWTGEIGRVLSATLEGGAKVAGFDMVIPASIETRARTDDGSTSSR